VAAVVAGAVGSFSEGVLEVELAAAAVAVLVAVGLVAAVAVLEAGLAAAARPQVAHWWVVVWLPGLEGVVQLLPALLLLGAEQEVTAQRSLLLALTPAPPPKVERIRLAQLPGLAACPAASSDLAPSAPRPRRHQLARPLERSLRLTVFHPQLPAEVVPHHLSGQPACAEECLLGLLLVPRMNHPHIEHAPPGR